MSKQLIQQLPEEVESWRVITSTDNFGTKTAQSLPNWRTPGYCREDGAHQVLKEAMTVSANSFRRKLLFFLKGRQQTGLFQEMLLRDGSKTRMIREHVRLSFFNDGQIAIRIHFLQQTVYKSGEFPGGQTAIIGTPRVQFDEIVLN